MNLCNRFIELKFLEGAQQPLHLSVGATMFYFIPFCSKVLTIIRDTILACRDHQKPAKAILRPSEHRDVRNTHIL